MDRLSVLMDQGLSEYQARVYVALLDFPSLPAGALAKAAQIPRNRLYEVLEELQSIGLVEIILEDTRKYRAKPISSFLSRTISDLNDRIRKIEAQRSYMDVAFSPPEIAFGEDLGAGSTRVLLSRRAVAREIDRMIENASSSIVAASSTGGWARLFHHLEGAKREGLDVEIYVPRAAAEAGGVERLAEPWGASVRWVAAPLRTLVLAVDDAELLVAHPVPDDDSARGGRDFAILTTNQAMRQDHVALLRAAALGREA